jgi:hypothetical protein
MPLTGPTIDHHEIRSWAEEHRILPIESLPHVVDHEPSQLQLVFAKAIAGRPDWRLLSWEEFFCRFDLLGLAFVYDDAHSGYNELLQREEKSPHISAAYRPQRLKN